MQARRQKKRPGAKVKIQALKRKAVLERRQNYKQNKEWAMNKDLISDSNFAQ
jgi:hypothetical protein